MDNSSKKQFTIQFREVTRQSHSLSDTFIQSKFALGLIDDRVWAEGLLVFYEVFAYLEDSIRRQSHIHVGKFYNPSLERVAHFEADLEMYYGPNWRTDNPATGRECIRDYINHLSELERTEPQLLIAYIYHLYLGLLSGGQILRRKYKIMTALRFSSKSAVVDFEPKDIRKLKKFVKDTMNEIADSLDENEKKRLLEEGNTVFKLNIELVRSINSSRDTLVKMGRTLLYTCVGIGLVYYLYKFASTPIKNIRVVMKNDL